MTGVTELDEQIERLRKGDTLPENEVKALCDKVSYTFGMNGHSLMTYAGRRRFPQLEIGRATKRS